MSGVFGVYTSSSERGGDKFLFLDNYSKMCKENLKNRGPDYQNHLIIDNKLLLGNTRLSIIDDDFKSNQPFSNENYFLSFDGEIYNFNELKDLIKSKEKYTFNTASDTEVLFKGLQLLGNDFFKYTNGMYAVAFYNKFTEELILHRDPGGMKPLFYTINEKGVFFSSDIKSLLNIQANKLQIDYSALAEFSKFSSIYGKKTFYSNIKQLLPGEIITIGKDLEFKKEIIKISDFLPNIDNKDKSVLNLVKDAVERNLVGNKKICLLLSSGIDSTTLAFLLAQSKIRDKIHTFTANFLGDYSNYEEDIAEEIASKLNLKYTKINIKYKGFLDTIDRVLLSHSQPFSDTKAITLEHVYSQINQEYKVIIQGDGCDELFGGHNRYIIEKFFELVEYNRYLIKLIEIFERFFEKFNFKFGRLFSALCAESKYVFHATLMSQLSHKDLFNRFLKKEIQDKIRILDPYYEYKKFYENTYPYKKDYLMLADQNLHLRNIHTAKIDRISMNYSTECRLPFFDRELSCHIEEKIGTGISRSRKKLLKDFISEKLPIIFKKMKKKAVGFSLKYWLLNYHKFEIETYLYKRKNSNIVDSKKFLDYFLQDKNFSEMDAKQIYKLLLLLRWEELFL